jgi:hypothetical protein
VPGLGSRSQPGSGPITSPQITSSSPAPRSALPAAGRKPARRGEPANGGLPPSGGILRARGSPAFLPCGTRLAGQPVQHLPQAAGPLPMRAAAFPAGTAQPAAARMPVPGPALSPAISPVGTRGNCRITCDPSGASGPSGTRVKRSDGPGADRALPITTSPRRGPPASLPGSQCQCPDLPAALAVPGGRGMPPRRLSRRREPNGGVGCQNYRNASVWPLYPQKIAVGSRSISVRRSSMLGDGWSWS